MNEALLSKLSRKLAETADRYDTSGEWPKEAMEAIGAVGGWRWAVPHDYEGDGLGVVDQLLVYEAIARGDVSTALIVTQRDGAIDLIAKGDNHDLMRAFLPRYATGELFTTVGISQITTSRQGGKPAMSVRMDGDDAIFDGLMPWVTGADHADDIVTAGVLGDGRQLLALMHTDAPGVEPGEPMQIAGVQSSHTAAVKCATVRITPDRFLRPPMEQVLARRSPVKNWVTSAVGLGLAASMFDQIETRRETSPVELLDPSDEMRTRFTNIRQRLLELAAQDDDGNDTDKVDVDAVRHAINDMLIRLSGLMMLTVKGSGYLSSHAAQRLAREALFFCVWSAPDAVRIGTARELIRR